MAVVISRLRSTPNYAAAGFTVCVGAFCLRRINPNVGQHAQRWARLRRQDL